MSSMLYFIATLAALTLVAEVDGLKCWSCDKAITNEECNAKGQMQTCSDGQACTTTVISNNNGSSYGITKGCRKPTIAACKILKDSKNKGMYPMQCQYDVDGSVCQCCCNTDSCNGPQMECKDMITCRKPDAPGNGRVKCPKSITYGSKCIVKCNRGYERAGPRTMVCTNRTNQGEWSPSETIACLHSYVQEQTGPQVPLICDPRLKDPEHGSVVCVNTDEYNGKRTFNYIGSTCAFRCEPGYFLTGLETLTCLPGGQWNAKPPKCIRGKCQKPIQDVNRVEDCTDGNYFGSTCVVKCSSGYKLVGSSDTTCESVDDNIKQGRWSKEFPKCVEAMCRPQLQKPSHGTMECSKKNSLGSICTFYCDDGHALVDTDTSSISVECLDDGEGVSWNREAPKCARINCNRLSMPENGNVACLGDGRLGSKCTFTCHVGYDLVGTADESQETVCEADGNGGAVGVWSIETVNCARIKCDPPREAPENGFVYCSYENNLGSVCTYSCDARYDLDGTSSKLLINICEGDRGGDGSGKWSATPGTCSTRYSCSVQVDPEHGSVSCDDEFYLGSACQFACEDGYELKGIGRITCRDLKNDGDENVEWSDPAPVCIVSTCPALWYDMTSLTVTCDTPKVGNDYPVGTKCSYACSEVGHYLEYASSGKGNGDVKCIKKNMWNQKAAPRCLVSKCKELAAIKNGNRPTCTKDNEYGSVCRYQCDDKYTASHSDPLVCDGTGNDPKTSSWDKEPPMCVLNECKKVPVTPSRGTVECSSGAKLGSYCTLSCSKGYAAKVNRVDCALTSATVDGEKVEIPKFQFLQDFCCAQCRSDFNFVQIVDARFETALQNAIDFTKVFVTQLAGQENRAFFSTLMFSNEVNESSVIKSTSVRDDDSVGELFDKMQSWEIDEEGLKSDYDAAITYALDVMFANLDKDSANFLIIAADGSPDKVKRGLVTKFKNKGIHILVTTSENYAKIEWGRLLGGGDNVLNHDANDLMNRVYDLAFINGCSNMADSCV